MLYQGDKLRKGRTPKSQGELRLNGGLKYREFISDTEEPDSKDISQRKQEDFRELKTSLGRGSIEMTHLEVVKAMRGCLEEVVLSG